MLTSFPFLILAVSAAHSHSPASGVAARIMIHTDSVAKFACISTFGNMPAMCIQAECVQSLGMGRVWWNTTRQTELHLLQRYCKPHFPTLVPWLLSCTSQEFVHSPCLREFSQSWACPDSWRFDGGIVVLEEHAFLLVCLSVASGYASFFERLPWLSLQWELVAKVLKESEHPAAELWWSEAWGQSVLKLLPAFAPPGQGLPWYFLLELPSAQVYPGAEVLLLLTETLRRDELGVGGGGSAGRWGEHCWSTLIC